MKINGDNGQSKFVDKLAFIQATLKVANKLAVRTRSYVLEMTFDQKGESYAVRKAARFAALKKCKAIVEKEFENRHLCEMTEEVTDERTFDEMFLQLKEFMVKFQQELPEYDIDFLPMFDREHKRVCVLVSKQLLRYQIKPKYKTFFKTPEELNRFASHHFQSTFLAVLLDSINGLYDELKMRHELELELTESKSSEDFFNDNFESDDETDFDG